MSKYKQFLDIDVLTAARDRIRQIFDLFDTVAVCFSGGKDSLVCLHLVWQEAQSRGMSQIDVIFRDEELIPDSVIRFVDGYRQQPWVRMRWFCLPLRSDKFVLGRRAAYVQWDPQRPWLRQPPAWAIRPSLGNQIVDQYSSDEICAAGYAGSVCFVTGQRCDESLVRYRAVANKLNLPFISTPMGGGSQRVRLGKPIYDWTEEDVFQFLGESRIPYCPLYDSQLYAGNNLRVSTPLHAETAKRFGLWAIQEPEFYAGVLKLFPEMRLQELYWHELDRASIKAEYSDGQAGCERYITEVITDPEQHALALKRLQNFEVANRNDPEQYPWSAFLQMLMGGSLKRNHTGIGGPRRKKASAQDAT